ncbi:MAG: cell division protein FtsZ [Alphaproteobacteria bacterium]|nr:cell division protein FtsZ [Alphaproteobacteria bacterium]
MGINLSTPKVPTELTPKILVFGVGGAGGNAVNNMIQSELEGVEYVVANTDAQALSLTSAKRKIQLGSTITQGLGAGARPEIGRASAEEGAQEISDHLQGNHMAFITAGMGGGTGTGAAPVIARLAREQGLLTVAVVTKPFHFEGTQRMRIAEEGLDDLQEIVDTLIVIPNQNLFRVADEKTTFSDAFKMADDVLYAGVRGVTDLMTMPGLINLDFADIRTVMSEMGKAMMGAGEAEGEGRAVKASDAAISNPLLDDVSLRGARGVLINITGGNDMTLYEVDEAANRIREEVDPDANIIFGSTFDEGLQGKVRVSIFATGITGAGAEQSLPIRVREERPQYEPPIAEPLAASQAQEEPIDEPAITLEEREEAEAEGVVENEDLFKASQDTDEPEAEVELADRRERIFGATHEDKATIEDAGEQFAPGVEAAEEIVPPIVKEVPTADSRRPTKRRRRRRGSRLLGLLIDNSDDDDEYPRETADKPESDDSPAGEAESEPDKLKSAVESPGEAEFESAEILEIPAFLRRQAN